VKTTISPRIQERLSAIAGVVYWLLETKFKPTASAVASTVSGSQT
jgi:hypothetical protein